MAALGRQSHQQWHHTDPQRAQGDQPALAKDTERVPGTGSRLPAPPQVLLELLARSHWHRELCHHCHTAQNSTGQACCLPSSCSQHQQLRAD